MADKKKITSFILDIIVRILNFILSYMGKGKKGKKPQYPTESDNINYKPDNNENVDTKSKLNDYIKKRTIKSLGLLMAVMLSFLSCGCFSFNFGNSESDEPHETETVLTANSNNVYRLSRDTILDVKMQENNGKWKESKYRVLIPSDWYIVNGDALQQ